METVQSDPRSRELGLWIPGGKEAAQPDPARLCDPAWLSGTPVTLSEPQAPHVRGAEAHRADVVDIGTPSAGPPDPKSSDPAPGLCGRAGAPAPFDLTQSRPWGHWWLTWTRGATQHRDMAPRAPWLRADAFKMEQWARLVPALACPSAAVVAELPEGLWAGPPIRGPRHGGGVPGPHGRRPCGHLGAPGSPTLTPLGLPGASSICTVFSTAPAGMRYL